MSEQTGLRDDYRRPTLWKRMLGVYDTYFESLSDMLSDEEVAEQLLSDIQSKIRLSNASMGKGETRDRMIQNLPPGIIARCLLRRHHFVNVD